MKYVPDLIPEKSKVLPDYFKGDIYKATKKNYLRDIILWVIGIFFFLSALAFIKHPLLTLIFGFTGFILIPSGHKFLEKKLKFRLTSKIKTIGVSVLLVGSVPLTTHYAEIDKQIAHEQKLADAKAAREKLIFDKKEKHRKDSLAFYITKGNELAKKHKLREANTQLEYAMTFAALPQEKGIIEKEKNGIALIEAMDLIKTGKYSIAIPKINSLLYFDPSNSELRYQRSVCYSKTGKIKEAVDDLKSLIQSNNPDVEKLYNKINPIRRRVAYYVTRCCDGTTSNATGRGACSHHGGVCNWNDPVYEEYRKYK